jgi:hypothetical protein
LDAGRTVMITTRTGYGPENILKMSGRVTTSGLSFVR